MDREALIRTMYAGFNARDADGVLATMTADVDWPNGWEGGRVTGQAEVREYWTRQWAEVDPTVEPVSVTETGPDEVAVEVDQRVLAHDGTLLSEDRLIHRYHFTGDLIDRMDIEETEAG